MSPLPTDALRLAEQQHGVLSRQQLLACGCSPAAVHRWVAAGVLVPVARGCYRIGGVPLTAHQDVALTVLRCGEGARAGGPWTLALQGVDGFDLGGSQRVIVPPSRRVTGVDVDVVHSPVEAIDQAVVRGIPALTIERGLIDCAAASRSRRPVRAAYFSAKRLRLVDDDRLIARARDLGRVPGASEMRAIIASGALALESEGEWDLLQVFRPGDPLPTPQVWVAWRDRSFRLDYAYLEGRIDLEHDGKRWHSQRFDRIADAERDLALAELDIMTLRITKAMLRDPARTRERILTVRDRRLTLALPPLTPLPRK